MDGRSPERPVQSCASTVDVYGLGAVETVEEQPDGPGLSAIRGTQLPGCLHGPSSTRRRGDGARRGDEGKTTSAPVTGRECRAGHGRGLCSNLRGDFVGREVRHRDRWRARLVTLAVKAVVPAALVVSVGWQIEGLPATSVRGPTHVVKTGKTPVLQPAEARLPLDADRHLNPPRPARSRAAGRDSLQGFKGLMAGRDLSARSHHPCRAAVPRQGVVYDCIKQR